MDVSICFAPKLVGNGELLPVGGISLMLEDQSKRVIAASVASIVIDHSPSRGLR